MNAHQRRKAYRAIKAMIGRNIEFTLANGVVRAGVVLGLTKPVLEMAGSDKSNFDGSRPSVHRIRVRLESKATMSPLISKVVFTKQKDLLVKLVAAGKILNKHLRKMAKAVGIAADSLKGLKTPPGQYIMGYGMPQTTVRVN